MKHNQKFGLDLAHVLFFYHMNYGNHNKNISLPHFVVIYFACKRILNVIQNYSLWKKRFGDNFWKFWIFNSIKDISI